MIVASRVNASLIPYLRSNPPLFNHSVLLRSPTGEILIPVDKYGEKLNRKGGSISFSPAKFPNWFTNPFILGSIKFQVDLSLFLLVNRINCNPQSCISFFEKRKE